MSRLPPRFLPLLVLPALLALLWAASYREIEHDRREAVRAAETVASFQARVFAENTKASIKRLNELLLDLRTHWLADPARFSEIISARQEHITDLTFQIAIIDATGHLVYSSLGPVSKPVYLGDREHFRVHRDSVADRLFISKAIKGRVSGKWSLQFTRPIRAGNAFKGIVVASIDPEAFVAFHAQLDLSKAGAVVLAGADGEVRARHPNGEQYYGHKTNLALDRDTPNSGSLTHHSPLDGIERVVGYARLPDYGLVLLVSDATQHLLRDHADTRQTILTLAAAASFLLLLLTLLLQRMLAAREKIMQRLRASQQQEGLLGAAIAQSNAAVIMTDKAGAITFVNDAFIRISGYTRDEVIGQNPRILNSGLNNPDLYRQLWSNISSGRAWQGELLNRKKDGELYWEFATISPVIGPDGSITHYIGVKEEITARKRQEEELRLAKEQAEAANLAKSQFLATMSHEIRTPMNGILGMAQLLMMTNPKKEERDEYARIILNSGNTLQTLLGDILDLSKVEAGKLELSMAKFSPAELIEETAALFAEPAASKGLSISATWQGPACARYRNDPIRIRQMLSNLLSNAIKFTEHGTITIVASELVRQEGTAELQFAVSDTGIGIPPDRLHRLFEPFTQGDASIQRAYGGTGLGLSIVRNLAELMGGTAGVESTVGQGSRFWFSLRAEIAVPHAGDDSSASPAAGRATTAPVRGGGHIMIVDDNEANRNLLEMLLVKHGYRISSHANGRTAVEAIAAGNRPDLVLMDCQMPVMNGFAATASIRQRERDEHLPRLPIIALTAGAFDEDREKCLAAGMDDFLTKPFDFGKLFGLLEKHMGGGTHGSDGGT